MKQMVWNGTDGYEETTPQNSELPEWPVQDARGCWHHEEFPDQRVVFHRDGVFFGFLAEEVDQLSDDDVCLIKDGRYYRCCQQGEKS